MPLNIEPLDRNQRTAFQEREALRQKVNEIIEAVGPSDVQWDTVPTAGHGAGYAVTSEGVKIAVKTAVDDEAAIRLLADAQLSDRIDEQFQPISARASVKTTFDDIMLYAPVHLVTTSGSMTANVFMSGYVVNKTPGFTFTTYGFGIMTENNTSTYIKAVKLTYGASSAEITDITGGGHFLTINYGDILVGYINKGTSAGE